MSEFGIERFSEDARQRMTAALTSAGLRLEPSLSELDRSDTLVLSAPSAGQQHEAAPPGDLEGALAVRIAEAGGRLQRTTLDEAGASVAEGGVRWFDVGDSARVQPRELLEGLAGYCGGQLTEDMVNDILSPDPRPRIKRHGPNGETRCVSAFRVQACESDEGAAPDSSSKAGVLIFEPVEFLVGDEWLITCWHDVEVYRGADRIRESAPAPPANVFREVERCWPRPALSSAGDLALLVLRELVLTYAPSYRQFYVWEEEWELDFYRRPERIDRETLLEVRAAAAVFRDWLTPLNLSGLREDVDRAWFPGVTGTPNRGGHEIALHIDDRIDRTLKGLRRFSDTLRSAYDLLQLRESERERERDDKFQRNIAVGGAVILIPTLVAGIMGANTWVPGQWKEPDSPPHWAFLVLIGVVMLSGAVAWLAIQWLQNRDQRQ